MRVPDLKSSLEMKNRTRNDKILWGNLDDLKRGSNARAVKGSYNRRMAAPNMGCFGPHLTPIWPPFWKARLAVRSRHPVTARLSAQLSWINRGFSQASKVIINITSIDLLPRSIAFVILLALRCATPCEPRPASASSPHNKDHRCSL